MRLVNGGLWPLVLLSFLVASAALTYAFLRRRKIMEYLFPGSAQRRTLAPLSGTARMVRTILIGLAVILSGLSILDPRWGSRTVDATLEGMDMVLVFDISRSMMTPDIVPDRLEKSRRLAGQLLQSLPGNRTGIVAFAGYAFPVIPLTTDPDAAMLFIDDLSVSQTDVQGSNLEDALRKALELFEKDSLTHKAIIIFTDGEDMEYNPMSQVKEAADRGITVYTVGMGTPAGAVVPLLDENGRKIDNLRNNGQSVVSRLNQPLLEKIASETRGSYYTGNEQSMVVLSRVLDNARKSRFSNNSYEYMEPQFQVFLLLALLCLAGAFFLPERACAKAVPVILGLFFSGCLLLNPGNLYSSTPSRASDLFRKGQYEEAAKLFQKALVDDPRSEKLLFNQGASFYENKEYDKALRSFSSLTNSRDPVLRDRAIYNMATSMARAGDTAGALRQYGRLLENLPPMSDLYQKTLKNIVYLKEQKRQQEENKNNSKDSSKDKQDPKQQQNGQNQDNSQEKDKENKEQEAQEQKPLRPTEIENMLNLAQSEEKKHAENREKADKMRLQKPKYEW